MKHEIPHMIEQGKGAVINTSSGAGLIGFPGQANYVAAKHGVIGLTRSAALEYITRGVRINAICPGTARSRMVDEWMDGSAEAEAEVAALHPIGRIAEPEEIARAALWLASDASSFVVGVALPVDGGYTVPCRRICLICRSGRRHGTTGAAVPRGWVAKQRDAPMVSRSSTAAPEATMDDLLTLSRPEARPRRPDVVPAVLVGLMLAGLLVLTGTLAAHPRHREPHRAEPVGLAGRGRGPSADSSSWTGLGAVARDGRARVPPAPRPGHRLDHPLQLRRAVRGGRGLPRPARGRRLGRGRARRASASGSEEAGVAATTGSSAG